MFKELIDLEMFKELIIGNEASLILDLFFTLFLAALLYLVRSLLVIPWWKPACVLLV
jgi:hypothetical protein